MIKLVAAMIFVSPLTSASTLDIYVYDWAGTPSSVLQEARAVLARILHRSDIELRWHLESPSSPEARRVVFPDRPRPGQQREMECAARRDIALLLIGHQGIGKGTQNMGYANPLATAGVNATILYERVRDIAAEHAVQPGTLLAHAIAHETGHVLMRSNSHRKHGLMAGDWDRAQYEWIKRAGMFFDRSEANRIKASISGEGCGMVKAFPRHAPQ